MAEVEELRVQPQDILAEQSVLGAIFIDESKLVFVREYIDSRDFFKYAHRLIFQAMVDLSDRGEAIDATTGTRSPCSWSKSACTDAPE